MSTLFLVHRTPHPPDKGDRIRSYQLLRLLAPRSDIDLACLADEPVSAASRAELDRLCRRVAIVPVQRHLRYASALHTLARGRSATEGLFQSAPLKRTLEAWSSSTRYDVVVIYCSSMVPYLRIGKLQDVPAVVDLVDVDSQKWFDYAREAAWPVRSVFGLEARRLRQLEASLTDQVRAVTLVSDAEAALLGQFAPGDKIHVIPNGVDLQYFDGPSACPTADVPRRVTFVGALDYRANIDGVKWFCAHVWPEIHRHHPDCLFSVVGRRPTTAVRQLGRLPGVEIVGQVDDVRPHYQRAALTVVPLRVARGIQNKVLEALAMRKAVVSSPGALEGLQLTDGLNAREAATPAEWVRSVNHLLEQPRDAARLGAAGRDYVERHHRWETCLQPFGQLLDAVTACSAEHAHCDRGDEGSSPTELVSVS